MAAEPPPARGLRRSWQEAPARVRAAVEEWLGTPVVAADTQPGRFSPGPAARLLAADGRRLFVKAVGPELNPDSPGVFRRERQVVEALPADAPVPRLLWAYDEGEQGWVALAFEDVEGRNPAEPWRADELARVLGALEELAAALTPSPVALGSASTFLAESFRGWRLLRDAGGADGLDAWSARHLGALAELEAAAPAAVAGETLLHLDVRADNLLLTEDRVLFVDWPHAAVGAAWLDLVFFAPSVAMQGGPEPEELLARYGPAARAAADELTAAVAATAGFFVERSLRPPPPGIPTVRAFQAAQGTVGLRWLAERTRWP